MSAENPVPLELIVKSGNDRIVAVADRQKEEKVAVINETGAELQRRIDNEFAIRNVRETLETINQEQWDGLGVVEPKQGRYLDSLYHGYQLQTGLALVFRSGYTMNQKVSLENFRGRNVTRIEPREVMTSLSVWCKPKDKPRLVVVDDTSPFAFVALKGASEDSMLITERALGEEDPNKAKEAFDRTIEKHLQARNTGGLSVPEIKAFTDFLQYGSLIKRGLYHVLHDLRASRAEQWYGGDNFHLQEYPTS